MDCLLHVDSQHGTGIDLLPFIRSDIRRGVQDFIQGIIPGLFFDVFINVVLANFLGILGPS
jgi:hypothetical protein